MKKTFLISKWPTAFVFAAILLFTSCKKDNSIVNPDPENDLVIEAAESNAIASAEFDDVFDIAMGVQPEGLTEEIGLGSSDILQRPTVPGGIAAPDSSGRCFTVRVVPDIPKVFPKTITIDFGDGCMGKDGKVRKGKIVTIFTGRMKVPGSKASITFQDFHVDSFQVEGTASIENTSSSNHQEWTTEVLNGKITNTESGKWKQWEGKKVRRQIEGNGTPNYFQDDVFAITGNAEGSKSNGNSWVAIITEPLIKRVGCQWRVEGTVQITRNGNTNSAIFDYGNGHCDNKATVTFNGVTHIITLH